MTWEEAVRWYRAQPGNEEAARANFFDLPVRPAVERYGASEEFREVRRLLGKGGGRRLLDLGAGNGIASIAFARDGWEVTAIEPDSSEEVGAGAISQVAGAAGLRIEVTSRAELPLPYGDESFHAIFARQVLHHLPDLDAGLRECARVLAPGGCLLAIRDHVVDDAEQLEAFLEAHPLHKHYGGEHAHPREEYLEAARRAGLHVESCWGPYDSMLNFFPGTESRRLSIGRSSLGKRRPVLGLVLTRISSFVERELRELSEKDRTPGRLQSFLARKPARERSGS
jgi:SAM-dependent methyltransferase